MLKFALFITFFSSRTFNLMCIRGKYFVVVFFFSHVRLKPLHGPYNTGQVQNCPKQCYFSGIPSKTFQLQEAVDEF